MFIRIINQIENKIKLLLHLKVNGLSSYIENLDILNNLLETTVYLILELILYFLSPCYKIYYVGVCWHTYPKTDNLENNEHKIDNILKLVVFSKYTNSSQSIFCLIKCIQSRENNSLYSSRPSCSLQVLYTKMDSLKR